MASSCTSYEPNCGSTSLCDQNCGCTAADRHTHTDTRTDKSLKTEGPKILSNDIFYFRTVIIGGPIMYVGEPIINKYWKKLKAHPFKVSEWH